jgi:hypothetical protein
VSGPLAGLFVGGNYQLNRLVIGAEGDWQWSNLIGGKYRDPGGQSSAQWRDGGG